MKKLTLIRHAKSSWTYPTLSDYERPLNRRGERDAPRIGSYLAGVKFSADTIAASPAERASMTATIIATSIGYPVDRIVFDRGFYGADAIDLLELLHAWNDDCESLVFVGHNPGLTAFTNYLTTARIDNVPTCGVVEISLDASSWSGAVAGAGSVTRFITPKSLDDTVLDGA